MQRAKPSTGQDLSNHLALLNTCLCDSHRQQRTLSPGSFPLMTSQHRAGPVQVAAGSSARSEVEAERVQAQQTLLHSLSRHLPPFPICVLGGNSVPSFLHTGRWLELPLPWLSGLFLSQLELVWQAPFQCRPPGPLPASRGSRLCARPGWRQLAPCTVSCSTVLPQQRPGGCEQAGESPPDREWPPSSPAAS